MEISNFKMVVTPVQGRIVQEFLFENGYGWVFSVYVTKNTNG